MKAVTMLINSMDYRKEYREGTDFERIMQKCVPLRKFCVFRQLEGYRLN